MKLMAFSSLASVALAYTRKRHHIQLEIQINGGCGSEAAQFIEKDLSKEKNKNKKLILILDNNIWGMQSQRYLYKKGKKDYHFIVNADKTITIEQPEGKKSDTYKMVETRSKKTVEQLGDFKQYETTFDCEDEWVKFIYQKPESKKHWFRDIDGGNLKVKFTKVTQKPDNALPTTEQTVTEQLNERMFEKYNVKRIPETKSFIENELTERTFYIDSTKTWKKLENVPANADVIYKQARKCRREMVHAAKPDSEFFRAFFHYYDTKVQKYGQDSRWRLTRKKDSWCYLLQKLTKFQQSDKLIRKHKAAL